MVYHPLQNPDRFYFHMFPCVIQLHSHQQHCVTLCVWALSDNAIDSEIAHATNIISCSAWTLPFIMDVGVNFAKKKLKAPRTKMKTKL